MKTAQWAAVLCVSAGIVFGLTFAVNYLGRGGTGKGRGKAAAIGPQAQLTWADNVTTYPADMSGGPAACEVGRQQAADFWFKNENAQTLPVGVHSKTCQCTSVQLWIASKDWTYVPEAADREKAVKELEAAGPPTELKTREGGVDVPAGAVGVLRLTWKGDKIGPKDLAAELWMGEDGASPPCTFTIRTRVIGPLRVPSSDVAVGDLPREKLPHEISFKCWSATRSRFSLSARVLQHGPKEGSIPFAVGDPAPLTEAELAELRKDRTNGPVLAGYAVHVTLLKEAKDGTPFDAGIFRRRIELRTEDADPIKAEPLQVAVHGTILGDLAVVGADAGPVKLGSFTRNQEDVKQDVLVESDADVTALEVDKNRTADYLGVEFPPDRPPVTVDGRKTWRLQVKWLPESQAGGKFPRDEEEYRDSAVYLRPVHGKPDGAPPSCLRIPVEGNANTPP